MTGSGRLIIAALLGGFVLGSCATSRAPSECGLEGRDWERLRQKAPLRVQVHLVSGGYDQLLDVVVRTNGESLVVVGFTHYGVRLFAAREESRVLVVEGPAGREPPLLASQVLDALLRLSASDGIQAVGEKEGISIRYPAEGPSRRLTIAQPRCGYDATLVEVSGTLSTGEPALPREGKP